MLPNIERIPEMPAHPGGPDIIQTPPQQPLPAPGRDFPAEPAKPEIKQVPDKPEVTPGKEPSPTK